MDPEILQTLELFYNLLLKFKPPYFRQKSGMLIRENELAQPRREGRIATSYFTTIEVKGGT